MAGGRRGREAILAALVDGPVTSADLAARVGLTVKHVRVLLTDLADDGLAVVDGAVPRRHAAGRRALLWRLHR